MVKGFEITVARWNEARKIAGLAPGRATKQKAALYRDRIREGYAHDQILDAVRDVPDAGLTGWEDIDRLDVRPGKGIIKVRGNNDREIQLDAATGEVLQVAVRRSDFIESIHDGSFFHESFKLWVFLPSAVILAVMWGTGIYLFLLPYMLRRHRRNETWNRKAHLDVQRQTDSV